MKAPAMPRDDYLPPFNSRWGLVMKEVKTHQRIIDATCDCFGKSFTFIRKLKRDIQRNFLTLLVCDEKDNRYLIKENPSRDKVEDMESVFSELEGYREENPTIVFPCRCLDGKFSYVVERKVFQLVEYLDLSSFSPERIEHDDLLRAIANLHRDIEDLQFPVTTWTYDWWLRLPLKRIEEQHGKNLPFVGSYQRFLARRLPQLSFKKGNVHSDLHRDNVCFLTSGELRFIDWDQAHIDAAAIDFIRPSALYFEVTEDEAILSSDHINELQSIVSPLVENINELDLRFLLVRSLLVHDDIRTSRESARMFLEKIKRFVAE